MSKEYRDDEYQIQEGRGWLPGWWMLILYGTVIFSIVFSIYMHGIAGWSQEQQYQEEVALYKKLHPEVAAKLNDDGSNPFRDNSTAIAEGEKTFNTFCAACHNKDLSGIVGPSLKDDVWLHGNKDAEIFNVIMNGVSAENLKQNPPKGPMPAHKDSLGAKKVLEVMAYIASKNKTLLPK